MRKFSWGYLAFIVLLWPLRAESNPWLTLSLLVPQGLYLAVPVLGGLWGLQRRDRSVTLANLLAGLFVLAAYTPPALHFPLSVKGDLTVLTWNLEGGTRDHGSLPTLLSRSAADIICLQECHPREMGGRMHGNWYEVRSQARPELVILSRFPISAAKDESVALTAVAAVKGRQVNLATVHLGSHQPGLKDLPLYLQESTRERAQQFGELERILDESSEPWIVGGDFGAPPQCAGPQRLARRLQDGFAAGGLGWGFTWSTYLPAWRLDYVWVGREFTVVSAWTRRWQASDHRPVEVTLRL